MLLVRIVLIISFFLFYTTAVIAEPNARVVYKKTINEIEAGIQKHLMSSAVISSAITLINENYYLPKNLDFIIGGEDGPLYDAEKNEISIPYTFVHEVRSRFLKAKYKETGVSADEATLDALMHTLFHELAHALISIYELPVIGKEEDAADGLASVLLIEFFEDGQEIAISAADLFDLESDDKEIFEDDFWNEHSLDAQRFYSTLCHVYGSEPEKYGYLVEQSAFSEERAELCIEEYEILSSSWFGLLKPYIKHNKALQRKQSLTRLPR